MPNEVLKAIIAKDKTINDLMIVMKHGLSLGFGDRRIKYYLHLRDIFK